MHMGNRSPKTQKAMLPSKNLTVMKEIQLKNQGVDRIQVTVTHYWNRYIVSTESIYLTVPLN